MSSSAIKLLVVIGLVCALQGTIAETIETTAINSWGDLSAQVVLGTTRTKFGIPFVERSIELSYPEVSFQNSNILLWKMSKMFCCLQDFGIDGPEAHSNFVKGIRHTETLKDPACRPKAEIVKGGLNQNSVTIKVTSARGCSLNSLVEFYIERHLQQFTQEFKQ